MQFKKTSLLTKLLILAVVAYALITLVSLQGKISATAKEEAQKQQELTYSEQKKESLDQQIADLGSDGSIERIARERLGMVREGEIVYYDSDD